MKLAGGRGHLREARVRGEVTGRAEGALGVTRAKRGCEERGHRGHPKKSERACQVTQLLWYTHTGLLSNQTSTAWTVRQGIRLMGLSGGERASSAESHSRQYPT